jgi:hypothetical protein
MSRGYKLTEGSVRSINATIRTVNQMRTTGIAGDLPFRQNAKRQPAGSTLQIGKTKPGEPWDKGRTAIVTVYNKKDRTSTGQDSKEIFNLFADVEADKWVAWIDGYLIAAECPEEEEEGG